MVGKSAGEMASAITPELGTADLGILLGISAVMVGSLTSKRVLRRSKSGKYDTILSNHAYIEYRERVAADRALGPNKGSAGRLTDAKAARAELELERERATLVRKSVV